MSEKFTIGYGEGVLQCRCTENLEKTQCYSLFHVFDVESVSSRAVQLHAHKRHVEDLHSVTITSGLMSCRVSYQITMRASIALLACDVTPAIAERFLDTIYNAIKIAGPTKFKVGDSICMSKYKTIFKKGYTSNWTTEVFMIVKVQHTNPVTCLFKIYREKSITGAFYEHELHRATHPDVFLMEKVLRRKEDKVYVKWLGFDGSHNSWIHRNNVI